MKRTSFKIKLHEDFEENFKIDSNKKMLNQKQKKRK